MKDSQYKRETPFVFGPGGMRCTCCNRLFKKSGRSVSQKNTKRKLNRLFRRNVELELE